MSPQVTRGDFLRLVWTFSRRFNESQVTKRTGSGENLCYFTRVGGDGPKPPGRSRQIGPIYIRTSLLLLAADEWTGSSSALALLQLSAL